MGYQPATYTITKSQNRWYYITEMSDRQHGPYCSLWQARRELKHLIKYKDVDAVVEKYNSNGGRIV